MPNGKDDLPIRITRVAERLAALEQVCALRHADDTSIAEERAQSLATQLDRRVNQLRDLAVSERESDRRECKDALSAFSDRMAEFHVMASAANDARLERIHADSEQQMSRLTELAAERARATEVAAQVAKEALGKAEKANDKRFEAVNEFRQQLADQAAQFMPRTESLAMHARNSERLQDLTDRINTSQGRSAGYSALYGWLVAAIGLIISIVIVVNVLTASAGN